MANENKSSGLTGALIVLVFTLACVVFQVLRGAR